MPFIILDRDGVINYDSDEYIKSPEEWRPIPGSLEAIAKLNQHDFRVLIATNQSGIARGFYDVPTLDLIHTKFLNELAAVGGYVEEIFFCPHHPNDRCYCRKPNPGLLYQMQSKYALSLNELFLIGDSATDVEVAQKAGCSPILVLTGKGQITLNKYPELRQIPYFPDLSQAVDHVLSFGSLEDEGK